MARKHDYYKKNAAACQAVAAIAAAIGFAADNAKAPAKKARALQM